MRVGNSRTLLIIQIFFFSNSFRKKKMRSAYYSISSPLLSPGNKIRMPGCCRTGVEGASNYPSAPGPPPFLPFTSQILGLSLNVLMDFCLPVFPTHSLEHLSFCFLLSEGLYPAKVQLKCHLLHPSTFSSHSVFLLLWPPFGDILPSTSTY